ncbi:MAG: hypothetical protein AABX60_04445, partial [Nanoarchaeota archaeon]
NLAEKLGKKGKTIHGLKETVKEELKQCANLAENHLKQKGWVSVEKGESKRKAAYYAQITDYLDNPTHPLPPAPNLDGLHIENDENGQLTASWTVSVGKTKVKEFEIEHKVIKAMDPENDALQTSSESFKKSAEVRSISPPIVPEHLLGWHEFTIKATSIAGEEFTSNKVTDGIGLYTNKFIELYQKHPKICEDNECNVIQKKKEYIKWNYFKNADGVYNTFQADLKKLECVYDSSEGMDKCAPAAVDKMYREMVKQAYRNRAEQQNERLDFPCHEKVSKEDNPQGRVCRAKNLVDNELKKNKGWHFLKGDASIVIIPSTVKVQGFDVKPQEDGTIKAEWTISGKVEKDFSFKIEHQFNRRASRDQKFENVLPTEVGPEKRDALLGPFGADFDGYHRLKLKVLDNIKNVVAESPTRLVGLYSDEYIELYNGEADDCKKHRIKTNGDEECDVVGNKRDSIRKNEHAKKVYDADQKLRNELEFLGCMPNHFKTLYEKGNNDGAVCRPQAVQALFTAAVKQYYTSEKQQKEFLTLQCRAENNPLGQVCRARQNLDKTLEN